MVEQWLLNPQNQAGFEQFLEHYWEEHAEEQREVAAGPVIRQQTLLKRYLPRITAVAAILVLAIWGVHHFTQTEVKAESDKTMAAAVVAPEQKPVGSRSDTFTTLVKSVNEAKPKTIQYARKKTFPNALALAPVHTQDTAAAPVATTKVVKATALTNIRLNDSALSKLTQEERVYVLNQMALNVNFHKASFRDIAVAFREKYGIVLELCASAQPDKMLKEYTASFSKIALPDLINDMSAHMAFSYTISNNVVKVCFN